MLAEMTHSHVNKQLAEVAHNTASLDCTAFLCPVTCRDIDTFSNLIILNCYNFTAISNSLPKSLPTQ